MKRPFAVLAFVLAGHSVVAQPYVLSFSTCVGGTGYEQVRDVATDRLGNIYITGGTDSENFPVTTGEKLKSKGKKVMDIFVMKFSPAGELLWATLLGGDEYDRAYAIEVDDTGQVYIAGRAGKGLPTSKHAFQPRFGGDNDPNPLYGEQDGFIVKLSSGGKLIWCSYFGGADRGFIRDIALDRQGHILIVETETSASNPHISGKAFQRAHNGGYDAVIAKISNDGRTVFWATYLGGPADDFFGPSIRADTLGQAVVVGTVLSQEMPVTPGCLDAELSGESDIFIAKLSADGMQLLYGTYLGGSGMEGTETRNLALDAWDNIIVVGATSSGDLAVTENAFQTHYGGSGGQGLGRHTNYPFDAFITKLSGDGRKIIASTYFGSKNGEAAEGVGVDAKGNIFIAGATYSTDLLNDMDSTFQTVHKGASDVYVACFDPLLSQVKYFSYLGGQDKDHGRALHVSCEGNIYMAGETSSVLFPSTEATYNGGAMDGFLTFFKLVRPVPCKSSVAAPK